MPLRLEYFCQDCGVKKPKARDTMICVCGGSYKPDGAKFQTFVSKFSPGYCPTLKQMVYSFSDQEKKAKKFRSPAHPMGFVMANDNKRFIKECKNMVKNREDVIEKTYAEDGIKYPKGKNVNWSDEQGTFVHRETKEPIGRKTHSIKQTPLRVSQKVKQVAAALILLLSTHTNVVAMPLEDIPGLKWVEITVNGKTYNVPEHKHEFYGERVTIWLRAIDGDKYARKYLLGDKDMVSLFMGDGKNMNRWLYMTQANVWVVE